MVRLVATVLLRRPALLFLLVGSTGLGLAVPGPAGGAAPGPTRAAGAAVVEQRSGCGLPRDAGSSTLGLLAGGRRRTVIVHVPTGYRGTRPLPLVLNLHGSGSSARGQEVFSGMDATSDAHGFLVAYPQGLIRSGSGYDWNVPGQPLFGGAKVPRGSPDDVAFLTGLVGVLAQRYCVRASQVDVTGFSGGARMASQLACDASSVFAAAAPVSGLRHPSPCPARRPVPILAFHGTADPVDPLDGHGQAYWTYSVGQALSLWARQDGCGPVIDQAAGPGFELSAASSCAGGAEVQLYTLLGAGHEWPGGPHLPRSLTRVLGPQSSAVDADELMWAFFSQHPMP